MDFYFECNEVNNCTNKCDDGTFKCEGCDKENKCEYCDLQYTCPLESPCVS